ncbi:hypothetical protein D8674_017033 [Pyrus ussuriensis x Pyrus communis]|uniref:Uncharacterized protein n=1 Tax=Pyrus ussuriensis x Pyrus communis TaxID=2448454 RepID=A0A5N5HFI3_9ROSA|nr:hypothetical protein D8674_017033 [Pyrus ussuriensis x Pyrus communis]
MAYCGSYQCCPPFSFSHFSQLGSSTLSHHIVSLTSSTYGLFTSSIFSSPLPLLTDPEVINSRELMDELNADSFRLSSLSPPKPFVFLENSNPNRAILKSPYESVFRIKDLWVMIVKRDVSMDREFREKLSDLMKRKGKEAAVPPWVFVKGIYIGDFEEVLKILEEGLLGEILVGCPKRKAGSVCEGCREAKNTIILLFFLFFFFFFFKCTFTKKVYQTLCCFISQLLILNSTAEAAFFQSTAIPNQPLI